MNRRNALARIAAALAALVAAPKLLWARKTASRHTFVAGEDLRSGQVVTINHTDGKAYGLPRELSRELTRISLSFYVPPWER